jgi:hypothetical protein
MFPVGLEPKISAGERPQSYSLDRAATGNGDLVFLEPHQKSAHHQMWINVASIVTNINAIDRAQVPSFGQCYT